MACICEKCGIVYNGHDSKMVMLRNDLWARIKDGRRLLCSDCIESIIGRKLAMEDMLFRKVNGIQEWVPCNYLYFRSKETGIDEALNEIKSKAIGNKVSIKVEDYNTGNVDANKLYYVEFKIRHVVPLRNK